MPLEVIIVMLLDGMLGSGTSVTLTPGTRSPPFCSNTVACTVTVVLAGAGLGVKTAVTSAKRYCGVKLTDKKLSE